MLDSRQLQPRLYIFDIRESKILQSRPYKATDSSNHVAATACLSLGHLEGSGALTAGIEVAVFMGAVHHLVDTAQSSVPVIVKPVDLIDESATRWMARRNITRTTA